jgi:hypothetical protein
MGIALGLRLVFAPRTQGLNGELPRSMGGVVMSFLWTTRGVKSSRKCNGRGTTLNYPGVGIIRGHWESQKKKKVLTRDWGRQKDNGYGRLFPTDHVANWERF